MHTHICIHIYVHTYMQACICTYTHVYLCMHTHTHMLGDMKNNNHRSIVYNSKILATSQHPSRGEINCHIYNGIHIAVKRNELELHESIWINSTNIILIKRKQFANEFLQYDIYKKVQYRQQFF